VYVGVGRGGREWIGEGERMGGGCGGWGRGKGVCVVKFYPIHIFYIEIKS